MKKHAFVLLVAMILIAGLLLIGCGGQQTGGDDADTGDGQVYDMILSHLTTEQDSMHIGALKFKEIIESKSDGQIAVTIYPNKILASSDNELLEQVRNNSAQMGITTNFIVASMSSELKHPNIFDFPFMFQSADELYAFCDSDLGKALDQEILEKTNGIKTYGPYTPSWYKIGTTKYPINSMADLKGLKIRSTTSEMHMATLTAFGANPTPINYGEVFTALQQGTVVGNATATNLFLTERYYELIKEMAAVNQVPHILYPCISTLWYDSLPEDMQNVVDESMVEYLAFIRDYGQTVEDDSLKGLEAQGVHIKYFNDEEKKPFIEASEKVWQDKAAVAGGMEYINQVQDFLKDYRENQ